MSSVYMGLLCWIHISIHHEAINPQRIYRSFLVPELMVSSGATLGIWKMLSLECGKLLFVLPSTQKDSAALEFGTPQKILDHLSIEITIYTFLLLSHLAGNGEV